MAIHDLQHEDETLQQLFRALPSVNEVLLIPACRSLLDAHPRGAVLRATRDALAVMRSEISSGLHSESSLKQSIAMLPQEIANRLTASARYSLRPVINATGVILHTNLGRAPLSGGALRHVVEVARDHCNLELDLETGLRSRRDSHVESLVLRVLGAANIPASNS